MDERARIAEAAHQLAAAISRRDADAVADLLCSDFVLRTPAQPAIAAGDFVAGIRHLPEGLEFVKLLDLEIDVDGGHALATGLQHARVHIDGQTFDERKPFVDWFVRDSGGRWKVRVALELASQASP